VPWCAGVGLGAIAGARVAETVKVAYKLGKKTDHGFRADQFACKSEFGYQWLFNLIFKKN
jgi:hypothetical protein